MDFGIIQKLANCIVRPPKSNYSPEELGSPNIELRNRSYQRDDFSVINNRGLELQCSFIRDKFAPTARETLVFLHANSSCRLVIKNYIDIFLPYYDLLAFDFAGCGRSQGQYVTLGYNQKQDVYSVLSKVRERYGVRDIVLWGRSMGAATAIFYAAKYGGIRAIVSDNSFSDLEVLVNQLSDDYIPFLPSFLVDTVIDSIQSHIEENVWKKQMTDFNIRKLKPLSAISKVKCPIFFVGSIHDTFVNVQHTKLLYQKATVSKKIQLVKGDHNDLRTNALKETVLKFLIGLNISKAKQRINIFRNSRGNSEKKNESQQKDEKITKAPYYLMSTHFIIDKDLVKTDQNDKREEEVQKQPQQKRMNRALMENYFTQMKRRDEKVQNKHSTRQSAIKRRRIFDVNDCIHKRLSEK